MIVLAALIAVGTAYGGLRIFLARQGGARLALSAIAFGFAVSGMHYTAMYGMRFVPGEGHDGHTMGGLVASPQVLALVVALLCFLIIAGFLLFLVPDPRPRAAGRAGPARPTTEAARRRPHDDDPADAAVTSFRAPPHEQALPLGGARPAARRRRRAPAGRRRGRHAFHRRRRHPQRQGRRPLHAGP